MRFILSCAAILISAASVMFNLSAPRTLPSKPSTAIVADLEPEKPILMPIPNHFCDDEYLGEWDVMKCDPREKDLRHSPELFSKFL